MIGCPRKLAFPTINAFGKVFHLANRQKSREIIIKKCDKYAENKYSGYFKSLLPKQRCYNGFVLEVNEWQSQKMMNLMHF